MIRTFPTRRVLVAGAAVALALTLGGCSSIANLLNGDSATRDEDTNEVTEGGTVDVFEVSVGDCIGSPAEGEVVDVEVVPCDEPHDGEVYYEFALDDGEWPGDTAVSTAAEEGCTASDAFEAYIGTPYDSSEVWVQFFLPTEDTWTDSTLNDRLISCIAYVPDEQQTGSLKDSGL
ncbi:septum formation family protein [Microbacterium betulae]|uniref:Septum formation family protein n=1 Tax=Microbacterium betulae TaxID=2981139 RepID=A0AA97FJZ0_9MICO|nr:septum formation family protein [Microbacterium sp. AB]WOF24683.1 septum formation family protein [Microbacterium sp. AB]